MTTQTEHPAMIALAGHINDLQQDAMLLHSLIGAANAAVSNPRHLETAVGLLEQMHEISEHLNVALDSATIGKIARAEA
jgi:hypothetical protein